MALANTRTSSPRDHVADANPDLARKKQRLSEDADSPTDGSVIIEACEPEDDIANMDNAIAITDGFVDSYSERFFRGYNGDCTPLETLLTFRSQIHNQQYLDNAVFVQLAKDLSGHVRDTAHDDAHWQQHYLVEDGDFFNTLAELAITFFDTPDLFHSKTSFGEKTFGKAADSLFQMLEILTLRILPLIPSAIKSALSRRDSAQSAARQQQVGSLAFVQLAHRLILPSTLSAALHRNRAIDAEALIKTNRAAFFSKGGESLATAILDSLSNSMREIKDAWPTASVALALIGLGVHPNMHGVNHHWQDVEDVMDVINANILPAICEKHPRALPDNFHKEVISVGERLLRTHAKLHGQDSAARLYERFVKAEADAILSEGLKQDKETALWEASGGNAATQARQLAVSWSMQVAKRFIFSDIMDIRTVGLSALTQELSRVWSSAQEHPATASDDLVIQLAARFLRQNEITGYIFGPESHAGLVSHSREIFMFLVLTAHFTIVEADIIWRACSTSVEADFANAAFGVLSQLIEHLEFEQLNHLAKKYAAMSVENLSASSVEFLPHLLRAMEAKATEVHDFSRYRALAFTSIDLLKQVNTSRNCTTKERMRYFTSVTISVVARYLDLKGRNAIYECCIPDIRNRSIHSTTAVEVLAIVLMSEVSREECEHVFDLLPLDAAVSELCDFVQEAKSNPLSVAGIEGVIIRLGNIARMIALDQTSSIDAVRDKLFKHLFGEAAISNEARNAAWQKLFDMTRVFEPASAAAQIWQKFATHNIPSLHTDLVTPSLVPFVCGTLALRSNDEGAEIWFTNLLEQGLWDVLVQIAVASPEPTVAAQAKSGILNLLFERPVELKVQPSKLVETHRSFIRTRIEAICSEHQDLLHPSSTADCRTFFQSIDLLNAVCTTSRQRSCIYTFSKPRETLNLGDADEIDGCFTFTAEICGPQAKPTLVEVKAGSQTTLASFLDHLQHETGTKNNRVIVGGVEVSTPATPLKDCGIKESATVMVRPRYSFDLDVNRVLPGFGPVHEEIMDRFFALERFIDGPDQIAQKIYIFLKNIGPSSRARAGIASPETTSRDLFPRDNRWRTSLSTHILQSHLRDFLCLGVLDLDFVNRSIRHLADFLLDEDRSFEPELVVEVLEAFNAFLQGIWEFLPYEGDAATDMSTERPAREGNPAPFADAAAVVSQILAMLIKTKDLKATHALQHGNHIRIRLAESLYQALLMSCKIDPAAWTAFTQTESLVELHVQLLFDEDPDFSARIARPIHNRCKDGADTSGIVHFYWRKLYSMLPTALRNGAWSDSYFDLLAQILSVDDKLAADEVQIREIIDDLLGQLLSYEHTESPDYMLMDVAMQGLLRLLSMALRTFHSFKKPLQLRELPSRLFSRFLFSRVHRPLVHPDTRKLVYSLMGETYNVQNDYDDLVRSFSEASQSALRGPGQQFPGNDAWTRPLSVSAGLTNLGMTCYMNSLLQQLYGNLQFRKFLLDQPILDFDKQCALDQVQQLFGNLQSSTMPVADTNALARALNIQTGSQEDVHGFYATFLSSLEDNMPNAEAKRQLLGFFTGSFATQIKGECGHVSTRAEAFTDMSITVKNKTNLFESLEEFVQGEPMEGANKYKCLTCAPEEGGRLVKAMKRTCLDRTPDNLTFCLKRFTFETMIAGGEGKVNDCFTFPAQIDMAQYQRGHLERLDAPDPDLFELTGVIVHQGSLEFGHYWSYVRIPDPSNVKDSVWVCLEDNKATICEQGIREVQEQCAGGLRWPNGNERPDNAYVLFYQRQTYFAEAASMAQTTRQERKLPPGLPMVPLPSLLSDAIAETNRWRCEMAALFDPRFGSFVAKLLQQYPSVAGDGRSSSESRSECSDLLEIDGRTSKMLEEHISDLIVGYMLRVLVADSAAEAKAGVITTHCQAIVCGNPELADLVLQRFVVDSIGVETIFRNPNAKVRKCLYGFFSVCLSTLREANHIDYLDRLAEVLDRHSSLRSSHLDHFPEHWKDYCEFAADIADMGVEETSLVLDSDYLVWATSLLLAKTEPEYRKQHPGLTSVFRNNELDTYVLFDLIYRLLSHHVDLMVDLWDLSQGDETRRETPSGTTLRREEAALLFRRSKTDGHLSWTLYVNGTHHYRSNEDWKAYPLGKLIGLLVSDKAHFKLRDLVEETMRVRFDLESHHLPPILHTALHYAEARSEDDFKVMLHALCPQLSLWDKSIPLCLQFFENAYKYCPRSIVESVPTWSEQFLNLKRVSNRDLTCRWLINNVFVRPFDPDNLALNAARARTARVLINNLSLAVNAAYQSECFREPYQGFIDVLSHAEPFLVAFREDVEARQKKHDNGEGEKPSRELLVEYDETTPSLPMLRQINKMMEEWESDVGLARQPGFIEEDPAASIEYGSDMSDADSDILSGASFGF